MASTEGLMPITRAFLASYYDKYPFFSLSDDVPRLSNDLFSMTNDLQKVSPLTKGESLLLHEVEGQPPHKIDENMWKNREQLEEIIFLLERSQWAHGLDQQSDIEGSEFSSIFSRIKDKLQHCLKILEHFQARNADHVFNTVMTYMPQDFRGTLIRQQKERSERNKQAEVDALVNSGGSIRERYALLWKQQMERRRQLAQLGSATGVYKTLVKYLVGVPQVLLDFIRQINDDEGPMEEQRQRYGPPLYSLTKLVLHIRFFVSLCWERLESTKLEKHEISVLDKAINIYASELERYMKFLGDVFANAPFIITAEEIGAIEGRKNDDYKEITLPAGQTFEVLLTVEAINSYIAWDFSLVQSKMSMDVGFSVEYTNSLGRKTLILPYKRYEADQGNFSTCLSGNYKLIWDNSYSTFFKKIIRYKVDCIPPMAETASSANEVEQ